MRKHLKTAIWLLTATLCLSSLSCRSYNPSLFPSYDVLNPGPEVRANPLRFTDDGNMVVNQAFMQWVGELQQEILKLRKGK